MQANAHEKPSTLVGGGALGAARTFDRIAIVRDLVGRKVPIAIAHAFGPGGAELVVVERYALDAPLLETLEHDARITLALRHPNIAQVRDVWREGGELRVAAELVEGETLEELRTLAAGTKDFSLEVGVRIVVDVLAALSALQALGGGGLSHGEVTATNVIVGFDGTSRIVRPFRGRVAGKVAEADWFAYAAPEVIRGGPADVRADLFGVGVLLWETLSRRKLFPKATREGRIARSMPIGKPQAPADASWAAPLGAVAERALANDPGARYTTAAEMAAAVRLAVRSKLAMPPRVAAAVDKLASTRILARRLTNALPEPTTGNSKQPSLRPSVPDEAVRALSALRPSSRPPTPKPGPVATMPTVPKAPLLPSEAGLALPATRPPRPLAPPLKLADGPKPIEPPKPTPPLSDPEPIDFDSAEPEEVSTASPPPAVLPFARSPAFEAPTLVPAVVPVAPKHGELEPDVVAGVPTGNKRMFVLAVGALLVVLIATAAIVGVMLSKTPTTPQQHPSATATTTTVVPTATTSTAAVSTTPPTTATATAAPSATPETTTEPDTSATTAPPEPSRRPRTRPRPTYDPMGI